MIDKDYLHHETDLFVPVKDGVLIISNKWIPYC